MGFYYRTMCRHNYQPLFGSPAPLVEEHRRDSRQRQNKWSPENAVTDLAVVFTSYSYGNEKRRGTEEETTTVL